MYYFFSFKEAWGASSLYPFILLKLSRYSCLLLLQGFPSQLHFSERYSIVYSSNWLENVSLNERGVVIPELLSMKIVVCNIQINADISLKHIYFIRKNTFSLSQMIFFFTFSRRDRSRIIQFRGENNELCRTASLKI